jgi:hypothetical protein
MFVLFWTVFIHGIRVEYKKLNAPFDPSKQRPRPRLPDDWVFVDPPPGWRKRKRDDDDDDGGPDDETPPDGSGGAGDTAGSLKRWID